MPQTKGTASFSRSKVQVFSIQGQFIRAFNVNSADEIHQHLKTLPAGTYIVKETAPGIKRQQIIRAK